MHERDQVLQELHELLMALAIRSKTEGKIRYSFTNRREIGGLRQLDVPWTRRGRCVYLSRPERYLVDQIAKKYGRTPTRTAELEVTRARSFAEKAEEYQAAETLRRLLGLGEQFGSYDVRVRRRFSGVAEVFETVVAGTPEEAVATAEAEVNERSINYLASSSMGAAEQLEPSRYRAVRKSGGAWSPNPAVELDANEQEMFAPQEEEQEAEG